MPIIELEHWLFYYLSNWRRWFFNVSCFRHWIKVNKATQIPHALFSELTDKKANFALYLLRLLKIIQMLCLVFFVVVIGFSTIKYSCCSLDFECCYCVQLDCKSKGDTQMHIVMSVDKFLRKRPLKLCFCFANTENSNNCVYVCVLT